MTETENSQHTGNRQGKVRLKLEKITKKYPAVVANEDIDLTVLEGEIHAVLGENGAGKSTLMKIIYGVTPMTSGKLYWEGKETEVRNPAHARKLGIGMVFQHFSLFETLTVAENVVLGLPDNPDLKKTSERILEIGNRYGLPVDPKRQMHSLSVGERQRVEIIRCLMQNPKLLIMDEPTSVLTPQAVRKLFETLRQISSEGCSILYISHKLDEIQELCHHATVLRLGRVSGFCVPADETPTSMAKLMIGKELPEFTHPDVSAKPSGECRLKIQGLSLESEDPFGISLKNINMEICAGEIVGIAGISGNGQQEMLYAISGEIPLKDNAAIEICGIPCGKLNAAEKRKLGMAFVPEERLGRGAVPSMDLSENALLTTAEIGMVNAGMIRFSSVHGYAGNCVRDYNVKTPGIKTQARSLSGGNLQKFIVGREMMQKPKLMVIAQPTWGLDVGAATFIRQRILDMAREGTAVLLISEELEELFQISDRLRVIANGALSPSVRTSDTNMEEIGVWMSGIWPGAGKAA